MSIEQGFSSSKYDREYEESEFVHQVLLGKSLNQDLECGFTHNQGVEGFALVYKVLLHVFVEP